MSETGRSGKNVGIDRTDAEMVNFGTFRGIDRTDKQKMSSCNRGAGLSTSRRKKKEGGNEEEA